MYILIDGFTETVHPLGSQPMEAILAFCDHIKEGVGHPKDMIGETTRAFAGVVDGTESELFTLVDRVSKWVKENDCTPKRASTPIFRLRRIPRPPCRECRYWKGHGVYCETGFTEQSAWSPVCGDWQPKEVAWEDVDPTHPPKELYENHLDKRIVALLKNSPAPVPLEEIEQYFARVESVVVRAAVLYLYWNGEIEGPEGTDDYIPTAFRARKKRSAE